MEVVVVMVVVVVDATHASHAIGQIDLRAGNCSHWLGDVTSSQSGDGSGVRSGDAPLQSSQSVPPQPLAQLQVYLLTPSTQEALF